MELIAAAGTAELARIERLATEIWQDHYTPIIGAEQVAYMLDKFQSLQAMQSQISEGYTYFGMYENEQLIGYLSVQTRADRLFLSKFYLHKSQRGKGFGSIALKQVMDLARERNATGIDLTVNKFNSHSISAYQSMGFRIVEEVVFDIGQGYIMDDYALSLDLE